jgi:probable rRNA maturation factor
MILKIHNTTRYRTQKTSWEKLFFRTLKVLKKVKAKGVIEVTLVSDTAIKELNKKHRKKNKITDVLSFTYTAENNNPEDLIGEIVISPSQADKQKDMGTSLKSEMNKLFVHGLLHIFGFDHENDEEFYTMNSYEKMILKSQN